MVRKLQLLPRTGLALIALAQAGALQAGDRRVFINESAQAWTLEIAPTDLNPKNRRKPEVGDMKFTIDGKMTRLGANGKTKTIILPAGGTAQVDFTHSGLGSFYHLFLLSSSNHHWWTRLEAQANLKDTINKKVLLKANPLPGNLDLSLYHDDGGKYQKADYMDLNDPGLAIEINNPEDGALLIPPAADAQHGPHVPVLPEVLGENSPTIYRNITVKNTTLSPWLLKVGSSPGKGAMTVMTDNDPKSDKPVGKDGIFVPVNSEGSKPLMLRFTADPKSGTFDQTFTLTSQANANGGPYTCNLKFVKGADYPKDLNISLTPKLPAENAWVRVDHLDLGGYLEIEDPNADVDWGEGVEH